MDLQIFLGILIVLALIYLIISRRDNSANIFSNMHPGPNKSPNRPAAQDLNMDQLRELARTDKIEAIKIYRQKTGVGLKEAMVSVEGLLAGEKIPDWNTPVQASSSNFTEAELIDLIQPYIARDELIEAIKQVRLKTNWGLLEAKEWVEKHANKKA